MKKTNKKGFTIVELVIVIVVIAILAAVMIPTFVHLVNKANVTVDMMVVKQMNTALQADEIVAGKPATVAAAKALLIANGCDDFTPTDANNVYYWVGAENRVILWTKDAEDATKGKVTYPDEFAKKYKSATTVSADWNDLSLDAVVQLVVPEGTDVKTALLTAIENAADGQIIQLPKNETVDVKQGGLYWLGQALEDASGVGKHITVDLNGATLSSTGTNARFVKDSNGNWVKDADDDYVMNIIEVPKNAELVLTNGKIEIDHGNQPSLASITLDTGSKLVLRDVEIITTTAGVMPAGTASEVVISNSKITAANYVLGTNRMESNNIRMVVTDSELTATGATALLINAESDTHIINTKITGVVHAIAIRAGHLELKDSTLITTDTAPGIYACNNFAQGYNFKGWWGTGNTIPAGTLVVGDYAKANGNGSFSYSGNAVVEMYNTKLQSATPSEMPEILLASSDPAKTVSVTYDADCTVNNVALYGSDGWWAPTGDNVGVTIENKGTITVNGEAKTLS
ncbi:MAG: prepilin-type N-terminal cleavage/methylation domain-containing protein [Clostridia bacterium]|nr:prepilin-type N-terminal cleavage/methylation domain-containing protein [Clostridia bacterium]